MHFLLTTLEVVYVFSTHMHELMEHETLDKTRRRCKWENDDYICRGHILNDIFDALFDVYQNVDSEKELWDQLESKYMVEDASSKKFLISNFKNYKMVDSRSVMEQYHELLLILGQFTQHGLKMDESTSVSIDYSSSDHLSLDDSSRDSSSSSSSETFSDSSADALSDSASSRLSSDHSLPIPSSGMRPSHRISFTRSRSLAVSVPLSSPTLRALSYAHDDILPSPKRIRIPETATDLELRALTRRDYETILRGLSEVRVDRVTHPVVPEDIIKPAQEGAVEVTYETLGDLVQRFHDHTEEIPVRHVQVIESVQRDQGHMIVATGQQSADMLERIREMERDNKILRHMMDVARALTTARSLEPHIRDGGGQEEVNGNGGNRNGNGGNRNGVNENGGNGNGGNGNRGNGNGGNRNRGNGNEGNQNRGNGNGNGGGNGYNFRGFMPTIECTYQDFLKCQPLNFNGTEGVVGLTHWFKKMETIFHINNYPEK
ncbi:hypothetical protein Tco_0448541 [Tanacetum coccineum]